MDEYIEEFIYNKAKTTKEHYTCDLTHFRAYLVSQNIEEDVKTIRTLDVQRYLRTLPDTPAKRRRIIAIRSFFHYLHIMEYIPRNPLRCIKVPRAQKCRVERKLSRKEVNTILSKAKGKTKLLVYLLFFLGLRVSEALKLKKKDIRYGDRLVTSVVGKGNKPRDVRAGKATSIFIWNVIKGLQDEDYLFPSRKGKHLSRWWAQKKLKKLNSSISPHWLRHAFCSLSIQNGCDIGTVSIAMGHSDLATTRAYCHAAEKPASEYLEECSI